MGEKLMMNLESEGHATVLSLFKALRAEKERNRLAVWKVYNDKRIGGPIKRENFPSASTTFKAVIGTGIKVYLIEALTYQYVILSDNWRIELRPDDNTVFISGDIDKFTADLIYLKLMDNFGIEENPVDA